MKRLGMSLRIKTTLALTLMTVISVLFVGFLAKQMVLSKFTEEAMDRAFSNFSREVTLYIGTYGSWTAGQQVQSFGDFARQQRPPFPAGEDRLLNHPPPPPGEHPRPPFRFVLTALDGTVIHGSDKYPEGKPLKQSLRKNERPIVVNGKAVLLAVPLGQPNLTEFDLFYIETVDRALIYAGVISALVAVMLGIVFGNRLSAPLIQLTQAISSIKPGEIRKVVRIRSNDEVGVLAHSFNNMSDQLADAYEELEQANSKMTEQAEQLLELSIRDELTGLYNRRHFREQAQQQLKHAQRYDKPLCIMLGDIDLFKKINDTYGHAAGDKVLKTVSQLLQQSLRETDLLARYGGEEFVISFPETDIDSAKALCERLRKMICEYDWSEIDESISVSISMGLESNLHSHALDDIICGADEKLYQAKDQGRNKVIG